MCAHNPVTVFAQSPATYVCTQPCRLFVHTTLQLKLHLFSWNWILTLDIDLHESPKTDSWLCWRQHDLQNSSMCTFKLIFVNDEIWFNKNSWSLAQNNVLSRFILLMSYLCKIFLGGGRSRIMWSTENEYSNWKKTVNLCLTPMMFNSVIKPN